MYSAKKIILFLSALYCLCGKQVLAESKEDFISRITGVYKYSWKINFYEGPGANPEYTHPKLENVLEIIPYDLENAYFRIHMYFDNAHPCSIYGIASVSKNSELKYVTEGLYDKCVLNIKFSNDKISFSDSGNNCKYMSCGARGSYDGLDFFRMKQKRKISYLPVILGSREYEEAVNEHKGIKVDNSVPNNNPVSNWKVPEFEFHK